MPFKFRHLCDLLQALDDNRLRKKATWQKAGNSEAIIITSWFKKHEKNIPRKADAGVAFLSCLFPEHRADRVYNLQEKRLEKIVGRSLALGTTRLNRLNAWRAEDDADFSKTVQVIMSEAEFDRPRPGHEVTLEEIDSAFDRVGAWYSGSSPDLRTRVQDAAAADQLLPGLIRRLQSDEVKWLLRMFLKNYSPVVLPESLVMRQYHFLLPDVLRLQNSFRAAVALLDHPQIMPLCPRPSNQDHEQSIKAQAAPHMKPQVGVMIQRPPYDKARSLQNCCDMAARRRISVERKYDGEYCQVHVDLSLDKPIKIFSKSGKDSTQDRIRLHGVIESALKLKKKDGLIKKRCILEGELLIWHEKYQTIQSFDTIRKHVTRNGRFIGTEQDSPADLCEKPMIMFYDLLLLDDIVCLNEFLEQRRSRLRSLIRRLPGQAEIGYREKINFASSDAKPLIRRAFAKCISKGWEGFVLKGSDDPYFSLLGAPRCIKLKKDYIPSLGDVADLAIVGGRKDAKDAKGESSKAQKWTTFYLACLENGNEVHRFAEKSRFRIVGMVSSATTTISPDRSRLLNELGQFESLPYNSRRPEMDVVMDLKMPPPTALFKNPFVVETVGSGFEKPQGVAYRTLRFPRISKIHQDRSWNDVISFDGLQKLAMESVKLQENEDSQEDSKWIQRLIQADPKSRFVNEHSPGKTRTTNTDSSTSGGTTSVAGTSEPSPLLVRIDTQDLTDAERQERSLTKPATISPPCLPSVEPGSLKQKRGADFQSPNTSVTAKRPRLSGSPSNIADTSRAQVRQTRAPSSTPPRRNPLRTIRGPSTPPSRENIPLVAVTQEQPSVDAMEVDAMEVDAMEVDGPEMEIEVPDTAPQRQVPILSCESSTSVVQDATYKTRSPKLSEVLLQNSQHNTAKAIKPKAGMDKAVSQRQTSPSPIATSKIDAQPYRHRRPPHGFDFVHDCAPLIYLSPAMPAKITEDHHNNHRHDIDNRELLYALLKTNTSFTFSRQLFLDTIFHLPFHHGTTHIVISNISDYENTGEELSKLHDLILERLKRNPEQQQQQQEQEEQEQQEHHFDHAITTKGQIIMLDRQVLQLLKVTKMKKTPARTITATATATATEGLSLEDLKDHFAGSLAWASSFNTESADASSPGTDRAVQKKKKNKNKKKKTAVPSTEMATTMTPLQIIAIWDWDVVVDLVQGG